MDFFQKKLKRETIKLKKGFSLVEVLITSAILLLVFGGLLVAFNSSLRLVSESRIKTTALTLGNDRMEYLRSLSYFEVGTLYGVPAGNIPQNRTVTFNGINFNERVLIEYVDDPADGLEDEDENGILADYKRVKVEYTWSIGGRTETLFLVSNIVPASIETDSGGGSLRARVFDANANYLEGIDVRLLNETVSPRIDVIRKTASNGNALFTGVPQASGYEIFVTAPNYSEDRTYFATTSLPYPSKSPVAVLEGGISTVDFRVDRLSNLELKFIKNKTINSFTEDFSSGLNFESLNNVVLSGGDLVLESVGGVYENNGVAFTKPFSPSSFLSWGVLKINYSTTSDTNILVQFYSSTSTADLIPDSDLPGNSSGFSRHYVDLQSLSKIDYPNLVLGIKLDTSDVTKTPKIKDFSLEYLEAVTPLTNKLFQVRGGKTLGTLLDLSPVYKFLISTTTDSSGEKILSNLEWDSYFIKISDWSLREICPESYPIDLKPNQNKVMELWYEENLKKSLRVTVLNSLGVPIIGAEVKLTGPDGTEIKESGWCGQALFTDLTEASDYELSVSAPDFGNQTLSGIIVNGEIDRTIVF